MKYFLVIICLLGSMQIKAQTADDSVKNVINTLFKAMATSDSVLLESTFTKSAILQSVGRNKEGETIVRTDKVSDFSSQINKTAPGDLDERITFDMVRIDGNLASVWTPYQFFYKEKFSHCGVNSFQLVRTMEGWKIQYLVDTRRKTDCKL